ncbi:MAG TPA: methyltransferase domain-containing protein [Terriglobales bacterium]|nr:methyltransferase domain-containing protein [Terriglobales bacterium]
MSGRLCPRWVGYLLVSPIRRLLQDPRAILGPFVTEGMNVLEPGPGMGFFTLELARLVGPRGRVVAIDVQPRMLDALRRRARRAGLDGRIETRAPRGDRLGVEDLEGRMDFALAFAVVHELPSVEAFFADARAALRAGGRLLLAEPTGHVSEEAFARTLDAATRAGFRIEARPSIPRSRSALLVVTT